MNNTKTAPFLSISEYKNKYLLYLLNQNLIDYFDISTADVIGRNYCMIKFIQDDYVPGCGWPDNYGLFTVTDFTKYKTPKGRKKVIISESEHNYIDSPDMYDLIPYELHTTAELIEQERRRSKYSLYKIPGRFFQEYSKRLLVKINGELAQGDELTEEMLQEVISKMNPEEYACYLKAINNINIDLWPTVELPIKVRICGVDDGAIEAQFSSMEKYNEFIERVSMFKEGVNTQLMEGHFRFQFTD